MTGLSVINQNADRRVTIVKDSLLEYPELWMEVFIGPGPENERRPFFEFFAKARCTKADTPETADLVVFVGGSDVNPALYGAQRHETTYFDSAQDEQDMKLFKTCYDLGIPMLGVCRGAQFLHVMHGGKLYQDVDNHVGAHTMYDVRKKKIIHNVSSVHHQMCIANQEGGMELLGDNSGAETRWLDPEKCVVGHRMDVEAYFYRDTCTIGIQGHPEYKGYSQFSQWAYEVLLELVVENPDIDLVDKYRRIKPALLEERKAAKKSLIKELN